MVLTLVGTDEASKDSVSGESTGVSSATFKELRLSIVGVPPLVGTHKMFKSVCHWPRHVAG